MKAPRRTPLDIFIDAYIALDCEDRKVGLAAIRGVERQQLAMARVLPETGKPPAKNHADQATFEELGASRAKEAENGN